MLLRVTWIPACNNFPMSMVKVGVQASLGIAYNLVNTCILVFTSKAVNVSVAQRYGAPVGGMECCSGDRMVCIKHVGVYAADCCSKSSTYDV